MARYLFEFYQEIQKLTKSEFLNPPFPILIYNGDAKWTAPERFSELLFPSAIPKEYIPEFRYFKIAINEIPKRELVKIRNAVSAVFYIENSTAAEIEKNMKTLISLLKTVFKKDGMEIVNTIKDRILSLQNMPTDSKTITSIEDITEVLSMYETRTKQWEASVLERGIEQGIAKTQFDIAAKMITSGMSNEDIRKITGIAIDAIVKIRKKSKQQ